MKIIFAILLLALSVNAFAAPDNERIIQRRGEIKEIYSMSEMLKNTAARGYKQLFIDQCLALRNNDPQCHSDGIEPVAILAHYTAGFGNLALLPKDIVPKKGEIILTQATTGQVTEVLKILQENEAVGACKWSHTLVLMGGMHIECPDDKQNGWEETRSILEFYPLKH